MVYFHQELCTKRLEGNGMEATAVLEPQTIKISSKRQITIPAKAYKEMGFSDYALVEQTREGLLIRPLNVDDEDISVYVLRKLVDAGYEGDELIERYKDACPAVLDFRERLRSSEQQIGEGDTVSFADMQKKMCEKYGL